ncbi:hypothetical protein C1701_19285 [Actinoalloteichus sp. AHMU CJ021]|uniref:AAA domain-containing protein n=1 Tax=Actinoalloteichus caeruleus DSM 43889 TaxID=1120930 RepID=A0ABT1JP75_ACTCY|nr:AAA family ATPase [Actinoalloteichus caeruleus]AUS80121.1 hypothetical protein C1701_19285 [Actinoalloteichus sp. AHMU CJ021]MCP2334332.1 AAA domain-containing protein [Actinoalloteichus caeruleus DSM 43889]
MLIWINGPFGVGKTQVAHELEHRLPGSFVCDPEQLGFALRRMTPPTRRGDFQDLPLWRRGVREFLSGLVEDHDGHVIVPMTLINPDYHDEIVGGLRRNHPNLRHVTLLTSEQSLLRRIRYRGEGRASFAAGQARRCLDVLSTPQFDVHVDTEHQTIAEVAEDIAEHCGLRLSDSAEHPVRRAVRRVGVQLRHVRFD